MRKLAASLILTASAAFLAPPAAAAEFDPEGKYELVQPPQQTSVPKDKVEVVDVFWYGCPHCWRLLPVLETWEKTKADYVEYRHMPAIFRETWAVHARAFYTAELLGVTERLHRPIFEAIHEGDAQLDSESELADFFASHGVAKEDFKKTYTSFAVESLVRKSLVMQKGYGIRGTPTVIVNGKYRVSGSTAGSYEVLVKVIDALARREHEAARLASN